MEEQGKDFKHIVRVMNTDLDGSKPIGNALKKIKGVGPMFSNAICKLIKLPMSKKTGYLSEGEVEKLNAALSKPKAIKIPIWMFNRRKDMETGEDIHLFSADLRFQKDNDIKMMKKTKAYKGIRHGFGLPVRGQSTKSNFRRNKGKNSLGVKKKSKK